MLRLLGGTTALLLLLWFSRLLLGIRFWWATTLSNLSNPLLLRNLNAKARRFAFDRFASDVTKLVDNISEWKTRFLRLACLVLEKSARGAILDRSEIGFVGSVLSALIGAGLAKQGACNTLLSALIVESVVVLDCLTPVAIDCRAGPWKNASRSIARLLDFLNLLLLLLLRFLWSPLFLGHLNLGQS